MKFRDYLQEQLKDPDFARSWAIPNAQGIKVLRARKGLTQEQLGRLAGTRQAAISRLENGDSWTALLLGRVAYALGYRAKIVFEKLPAPELTDQEGGVDEECGEHCTKYCTLCGGDK